MKSEQVPDNQLIRAARDGDRKARTTLGRWMLEELYGFFLDRFERDKAGELVQETVKDILANLDRFDASRSFRRWALGFAVNEARTLSRNLARAEARKAKHQHLTVFLPETGPVSTMLREEQLELLRSCMWQIPRIYREVLEHDIDSGDDEELAAELGISVITVRTRRKRGHNMLRALLEAAHLPPCVPSSSSSSVSL